MAETNLKLISEILHQVKKNKKYSSISDEVVLDEIKNYLRSNKTVIDLDKQTIKDIRKKLHLSYASFQTKKKSKAGQYLTELKKNINNDAVNKLLSITISTKERLGDYKRLYQKIFEITGEPKVIVDLGCGLNPVSFPLMNLDKLTYFAYDINEEDIGLLNDYFKIMRQKGLTGKAEILNLNNRTKVLALPSSDIVFLFKVLDLLDSKDHKPSEELINALIKKTKFIVASFATKTLTRKKMNFPRRKWFELMLERNNFNFKIIETENEIFYIVWK